MINDDTKTTEQENIQAHVEPEVDYKSLYLRTQADLQNYTKRTQRERSEWGDIVKSETIAKMLPIVDDLERALQTAKTMIQDAEQSPWLSGFELILKNAQKTLSGLGLEEIKVDGQFDPTLHEALMNVSSQEHTSGQVVQVLTKGYMLQGKVVRHAQVSVAA